MDSQPPSGDAQPRWRGFGELKQQASLSWVQIEVQTSVTLLRIQGKSLNRI